MKISFVMPSYKAEFLNQAIDSIIEQTYSDWELVVVDDCSPFGLKEIVDCFDDPRIRYYRNETNIGGKDLVAQWNRSIEYATGDWIVLAADDDTYDSHFCEEIDKLVRKYPECDLIRTRVEQIDGDGKHIWSERSYSEFISCYEFLYDWLVGRSITCVGNYAFRASRLLEVGGFINFPCGFCSDLATPFTLASSGVANTEGLLFNFRQTEIHLSSDSSRLMDKVNAISAFYSWLDGFEYEKPDNESDLKFYGFKNSEFIHGKCLFDYFNQVIKFVPLQRLLSYLRACELASSKEKIVFVLRWLKKKIF